MPASTCRHIKTNGKRCQSPSLGLSPFCYFHSRLHRRHKHLLESSSTLTRFEPNPDPSASEAAQYQPAHAANPIELDLPPAEDPESIQVSISLLITALARNRIDPKRAAVLLYGLQLASTNVKSIITEPYASSIIRSVIRTKSGHDLAAQEPMQEHDRTAKKPVQKELGPPPALPASSTQTGGITKTYNLID